MRKVPWRPSAQGAAQKQIHLRHITMLVHPAAEGPLVDCGASARAVLRAGAPSAVRANRSHATHASTNLTSIVLEMLKTVPWTRTLRATWHAGLTRGELQRLLKSAASSTLRGAAQGAPALVRVSVLISIVSSRRCTSTRRAEVLVHPCRRGRARRCKCTARAKRVGRAGTRSR